MLPSVKPQDVHRSRNELKLDYRGLLAAALRRNLWDWFQSAKGVVSLASGRRDMAAEPTSLRAPSVPTRGACFTVPSPHQPPGPSFLPATHLPLSPPFPNSRYGLSHSVSVNFSPSPIPGHNQSSFFLFLLFTVRTFPLTLPSGHFSDSLLCPLTYTFLLEKFEKTFNYPLVINH